jgi:hypothetical protein
MYFTTFNHYDDDALYNLLNVNANDQLCIICWEKKTNNDEQYMKNILSTFELTKPCKCNGVFHYDCLFQWIVQTNSCPICRSRVTKILDKDKDLNLQLNNNSQLFRIFNFICNLNCAKFTKLCIYILFINFLYSIICNIQNEVEGNLYKDNNVCIL